MSTAADAQVSVNLGADIANWRRNLTEAAAEVNRTDRATQAATTSISRNIQRVNALNLAGFNRSLQAGQVSLSNISNASNSVSSSLARAAASSANSGRTIAAGASQAANAVTNLGRVAQDAPFGFIGIQNNLNPLLESFQRLRAETGSNAAALRALAQQMTGAAGLGLALSVVSSGILLYQQYQQRAKKATEEGSDANKKYKESLDAISSSAASQAATAGILYQASQNLNIPLKDRNRLVDELQKQYPEYFKNMSNEAILAGKAAGAYDQLQQAILNTAIAKASESLLASKIKPLADLIIEINKQEQKLKKQGLSEGDRARRSQNSVVVDENGDLETLAKYKRKLEAAIKETREALADGLSDLSASSIIGSFKEDKGATKKAETLATVLKQLALDLKKIDTEFGNTFSEDINKRISAHQKAVDSLRELGYDAASKSIVRLIKLQNDLALALAPGAKVTVSANKGIEEPRNSAGNTKGVRVSAAEKVLPLLEQEQAKILAAQQKFNEDFNQLATNGIADGLSGLGTAIGSALGNGTNILEAAGTSLLSTLGGVIVELGKLAIATGIGIAAIKKALSSLNPIVAIGAGVALVALGSAIKSGVSKLGSSEVRSQSTPESKRRIPGFANGIENFGGGLAWVGEAGRELVQLPTGSSVIPHGKSERIARSKSGGGVVLNGNFRVGMRELLFELKKEEKLINRLG